MVARKVLQFQPVPYSLKADVDLKRQQKKKEGCGLMIAAVCANFSCLFDALWSWLGVNHPLSGSLSKLNTMYEAYLWLAGGEERKE